MYLNQIAAELLCLISVGMRTDDAILWLIVKAAVKHYSADPRPSAHFTGPLLPWTPGSCVLGFNPKKFITKVLHYPTDQPVCVIVNLIQ